MIPVKVQCGCGQKYAFDVEPVDGRMGYTVACPVCGVDGTTAANEIISRTLSTQPAAPPSAPAMRISGAPPPIPTAAARPAAPVAAAVPSRFIPQAAPAAQPVGQFNLGLGILGAFLGAAIGGGAMFGISELLGFRFPFLGVGIGLLTGYGAKLLYKGTANTLGIISGLLALISVVGTLLMIYGDFPMLNIISAAVSVSVAYRIASG